jgi:Fe-S-cluster containining protein
MPDCPQFRRTMSKQTDPGTTSGGATTCATCRACCCKLEVILMGDDDPPAEFVATDQWGGQVMKRLDDGWCAAVDRVTMLCRIYERRPGVCREFAVGESECLTERRALDRERKIAVMDEIER